MAFHVVTPEFKPLITLWQEYCEARGLTPDVLLPIGGELLDVDKAARILGKGIYAFKEYGLQGAFVYALAPGAYQGRLLYAAPPDLAAPPRPGDQLKRHKVPKYYSPSGSPNRLYVPPHLTDWTEPSTTYPLLLVEGALNAARLASDGFHAVAVTGVYNFHIGKKDTPMIPELRALLTSKQAEQVIVMTDSDTASPEDNPDLWVAVNRILQEITKLRTDRRDTIYTCHPTPRPDGSKRGPDDYLHELGIDAFNRLLREQANRFTDDPYLRLEIEFLNRFIWDESAGKVFDCKTRQLILPAHADNIMATGGRVVDITSSRPKLTTYSHKNLLTAPGCRIAQGMKYQPDTDEPFFPDHTTTPPRHFINKFHPDDVPPAIKGDVSIAYEMLKSLCRDSPSATNKILTIAARHAQEPALTPKYAILFTGEQRAGKSNFARLIGTSLSKRYHESRANLKVDFNANWRGYAAKEWAEFDKDMDEEWLKDLITGKYYEVNVKYGGQYTESNFTLNIFTCNGLQSKIQEGDGRFVIAGYARPDDKRLGLAFEEWVKGPGPNHFRWHLLNEIDASQYDSMNVWTEYRDAVIEASSSYKSTVKDYILGDLNDIEGLECVPNTVLSEMLKPHGVNVISFMKLYGQYFMKPAREMVKIDGWPHRFRAFKNADRWRMEDNADAYHEQFKLAQKLISGKKF